MGRSLGVEREAGPIVPMKCLSVVDPYSHQNRVDVLMCHAMNAVGLASGSPAKATNMLCRYILLHGGSTSV